MLQTRLYPFKRFTAETELACYLQVNASFLYKTVSKFSKERLAIKFESFWTEAHIYDLKYFLV